MADKPILHGRDHKPGGPDPSGSTTPYAWAGADSTNCTTGGTTNTPLAQSGQFNGNDSRTFTLDDDGNGVQGISINSGGSYLVSASLLAFDQSGSRVVSPTTKLAVGNILSNPGGIQAETLSNYAVYGIEAFGAGSGAVWKPAFQFVMVVDPGSLGVLTLNFTHSTGQTLVVTPQLLIQKLSDIYTW